MRPLLDFHFILFKEPLEPPLFVVELIRQGCGKGAARQGKARQGKRLRRRKAGKGDAMRCDARFADDCRSRKNRVRIKHSLETVTGAHRRISIPGLGGHKRVFN